MELDKIYLSSEQRKKFSRCFPLLLHFVLCEVEKMGLSHIMSWEPSGTHFKIHNEGLFTTEIAPQFFVKQSKIRSFYRQLNLWGFERVAGDNLWSREHFSRDLPEEIKLIKRCNQHSITRKTMVKQQPQQEQRKAPPLAMAKSHCAMIPFRSALGAVNENEAERNKMASMNEAKEIIRAYSARLKEISPGAHKNLLTSLLQQEESNPTNKNARLCLG